MKYLYGAAVQGIQNFIFQTNELKDIVGASELVENICTELFAKLLYGDNLSKEQQLKELSDDKSAIVNAAGNIKYIFEEKDLALCEKIVHDFPRKVVEYAPGITISQAVVRFEGKFEDAVDELERRLRAQRNKPMNSINIGLMGVLRSRKTGLPVVGVEKNEEDFMDAGTMAKRYHVENGVMKRKRTTKKLCCKAFGKEDILANPYNIKDSEIAYDIEDMTYKNDWIAVIHADGNGLGQIVQKIGKKEAEFKDFSKKLDEATRNAAVKAFEDLKKDYKWGKIIPIRPIVLGGDDFTVICRADLALRYVEAFIRNFEDQTYELLHDKILDNNVFEKGRVRDRLTACAGIAYVKSSYPFYYGYELAEALCSVAKKDAKSDEEVKEGKALPPSCIMFHKVQDSFVESYKEIAARELKPQSDVSFQFGPYYIDKDVAESKKRWTIVQLKDKVDELEGKEGNAVKSHIRRWLGMLHDNSDMAVQTLKRLKAITPKKKYVDEITCGVKRTEKDKEVTFYPAYDILAIHTINTQETKNKDNEQL